jgi:hypothetical protein
MGGGTATKTRGYGVGECGGVQSRNHSKHLHCRCKARRLLGRYTLTNFLGRQLFNHPTIMSLPIQVASSTRQTTRPVSPKVALLWLLSSSDRDALICGSGKSGKTLRQMSSKGMRRECTQLRYTELRDARDSNGAWSMYGGEHHVSLLASQLVLYTCNMKGFEVESIN